MILDIFFFLFILTSFRCFLCDGPMRILKIFMPQSPFLFFDIVILFRKPVIDCGYYNGISIYITKDISNVPEIFINCGCDHNPAI